MQRNEESSESKVMMPEIEISRLYLRQFSMADLNDISVIRSDPEVMRFIGAGQPHSVDQVREHRFSTSDGKNRQEKTGYWYEAELVYYVISQDGYEPSEARYELLRA